MTNITDPTLVLEVKLDIPSDNSDDAEARAARLLSAAGAADYRVFRASANSQSPGGEPRHIVLAAVTEPLPVGEDVAAAADNLSRRLRDGGVEHHVVSATRGAPAAQELRS